MHRCLALLLLVLPVCGQTRLPPTRTTTPPPAAHERSQDSTAAAHTRKGGPAPTASDAEIERAFREKLAKSKVASDGFSIRVQGGVATLEGNTEVVQHKGTATRMAKSAGASSVVNHIKISDAAKEQASGNLTTGRRRAQVKRSEVANR